MSPASENEPNYQSQDIWSRTTSANGYSVDELRSVPAEIDPARLGGRRGTRGLRAFFFGS
jgi:hypothetical protein